MQALILAGGSGTRFWPLSRRSRPKQLLALEGDHSLLRETAARLAPLLPPQSIWVCATAAIGEAVRRELPELPAGHLLLEPQGRNTAPAIGWSVRSMPERSRRGVVAVLPADHRIGDVAAFRTTLARAAREVERTDRVMALGVVPRWPETGYGYLELDGERESGVGGGAGEAGGAVESPAARRPAEAGGEVRRVARFVEKPDPENAARFAASGRHLWNAGIFVFRGETLLDLLARHQPELRRGLEEIAAAPERLAELYGKLPSESIDYALMEKIETLAALPLDCGWSDLGSWSALAEVLPADAHGNTGRGDAVAVEAEDNLLFAEQGTIAVLGVRDLVVVRTGDAVLVMPKGRAQEVRKIVARLAERRRTDLL